ncbi:MAG: response regulator transcription factor [Bacteroidota bacterium]|jgi:two-component system alkaline phosphatase synthesis response regulator PhoP
MPEKKASILLVEDEENLQEALKLNLELEGYEVTCIGDGAAALKKVKEEYFDLILLDVMLPELDGFDVSENIRLQNIETPILMLSARAGSSDRVTGLKKGADDYLTKPFNLEELLLRVEKLIEKNKKLSDRSHVNELLHFGGNTINFKSQKAVNYQGEEVQLSKKEIMLLKLMVEYKNEVVSREKILQAVWGYQVFPTTRTIDNFILNFRKYFEKDPKNPRHFHSIRSVGYRFTI